jgi:starch phosphorylase
MSLIEEWPEKRVRMAHLAIVGSHSVNGVAELHSRLLREKELRDFAEMYPGRFNNKTNGVTPRRWLLAANPGLADLITARIGSGWVKNLQELRKMEPFTEDPDFRRQWRAIKQGNKKRLASLVFKLTGERLDTEAIFDVQVKRIHEYKRQLMNILHVVYLWLRLKEERDFRIHPRVFFFGGKAAPAYRTAKMIIRLIAHVSDMVNRDTATNEMLKVIFLPNYRVSLAEVIYPGADVSEQISTAGYEASGTSNMKFALNGALTIGTLDGANIEIMEEIGRENIFIFGLTADEVAARRPGYRPMDCYEGNLTLRQAIHLIQDGFFCPDDPALFRPLIDLLTTEDRYMVLADFDAYQSAHMQIDALYRDAEEWTRKSILNVARIGKFSSDRTIFEYNRDIWRAEPIPIERNHVGSLKARAAAATAGGVSSPAARQQG